MTCAFSNSNVVIRRLAVDLLVSNTGATEVYCMPPPRQSYICVTMEALCSRAVKWYHHGFCSKQLTESAVHTSQSTIASLKVYDNEYDLPTILCT